MDDMGRPLKYLCRCTNPQDSGIYCEERNYCFSAPCQNGGSCHNKLNGFTCDCSDSWAGITCSNPVKAILKIDTNEIDFKTINHDQTGTKISLHTVNPFHKSNLIGEVINKHLKASMSCLDDEARCKNGGLCVRTEDNSNEFSCKCKPNYSGKTCEIFNICSTKPCRNDGQCQLKTPTSFECKCQPGYFGYVCEKVLYYIQLQIESSSFFKIFSL
jgi:protein crumbs